MEFSFTAQSLAFILLGGILILVMPIRWIFPVFFLVSLFLSMRNRFVVEGFDFMPHRILLVFAWARVLVKGENRGFSLMHIDRWLLLFSLSISLTYVLLWGNLAAVVNRLGFLYNVLGLYFLFRFLIRTRDDLEHVISWLGIATVVLAGFMFIEFATAKNPLALLGHVEPEVKSRLGRLRCQAAFGHPISAGVFGATLLPLWVACWWQSGKLRKWATPGVAASTIITLAAGSSTPVGAYLIGLAGLGLWHLRQYMRLVRWSVVFGLLGLHMVMKAPVWALLGRANFIPGSTGYHRYRLVDTFIEHLNEWWLLGVKSTEEWGYLMDDITNQFLAYGTKGGLLGVFLFIAVLGACFREVGRLVRFHAAERSDALLIWSFGTMLFAHCAVFLGYSYWDQIIVLWYLLLAMCASMRLLVLEKPAQRDTGVVNEPFAVSFATPHEQVCSEDREQTCRQIGVRSGMLP